MKLLDKLLCRSETELRSIVLSHGWYALPPFCASIYPVSLSVAFDGFSGRGSFRIITKENKCYIILQEGNIELCKHVAGVCLSQDVDTTDLYNLIGSKIGEWKWITTRRAGKFLRSPSLFEDCCKAILTTNTTWDRTIRMVERLVDNCGEAIGLGRAFPLPHAIMDLTQDKIRSATGCGYRASYIIDLCRKALSLHDIFLSDGWKRMSNEDFYACLVNIKGIGESTANYLAMVYWKPHGFVMDAYVRRRCYEIWGVSERNLHSFLNTRYGQFEEVAPVIMWFDLTKHWRHVKRTAPNTVW